MLHLDNAAPNRPWCPLCHTLPPVPHAPVSFPNAREKVRCGIMEIKEKKKGKTQKRVTLEAFIVVAKGRATSSLVAVAAEYTPRRSRTFRAGRCPTDALLASVDMSLCA
jgi:hypothetical protein